MEKVFLVVSLCGDWGSSRQGFILVENWKCDKMIKQFCNMHKDHSLESYTVKTVDFAESDASLVLWLRKDRTFDYRPLSFNGRNLKLEAPADDVRMYDVDWSISLKGYDRVPNIVAEVPFSKLNTWNIIVDNGP